MEWIKYNGQELPKGKNLIYAYCDWSPFQVEECNGPKFFTSTVYHSDWYVSLIAYAILDDYVPDEEDFSKVTSLIRRNYNKRYKRK